MLGVVARGLRLPQTQRLPATSNLARTTLLPRLSSPPSITLNLNLNLNLTPTVSRRGILDNVNQRSVNRERDISLYERDLIAKHHDNIDYPPESTAFETRWTVGAPSMLKMIQNKNYQHCVEYFRNLQKNGPFVDLDCYVAAFQVHEKIGSPLDVVEDFDDMVERGIAPSKKAYAYLIKSLCILKQFDEAFERFEKLKELGVPPPRVYALLIDMCGKMKRFEEGEQLIEAMSLRADQDSHYLNAVLQFRSRQGAPIDVVEDAFSAIVDSVEGENDMTWTRLLSCYNDRKDVDGFLNVLERMRSAGAVRPDSDRTRRIFLDLFAKTGDGRLLHEIDLIFNRPNIPQDGAVKFYNTFLLNYLENGDGISVPGSGGFDPRPALFSQNPVELERAYMNVVGSTLSELEWNKPKDYFGDLEGMINNVNKAHETPGFQPLKNVRGSKDGNFFENETEQDEAMDEEYRITETRPRTEDDTFLQAPPPGAPENGEHEETGAQEHTENEFGQLASAPKKDHNREGWTPWDDPIEGKLPLNPRGGLSEEYLADTREDKIAHAMRKGHIYAPDEFREEWEIEEEEGVELLQITRKVVWTDGLSRHDIIRDNVHAPLPEDHAFDEDGTHVTTYHDINTEFRNIDFSGLKYGITTKLGSATIIYGKGVTADEDEIAAAIAEINRVPDIEMVDEEEEGEYYEQEEEEEFSTAGFRPSHWEDMDSGEKIDLSHVNLMKIAQFNDKEGEILNYDILSIRKFKLPIRKSQYDVDPSAVRTPWNPFREVPENHDPHMEDLEPRALKGERHIEDMQRYDPERYKILYKQYEKEILNKPDYSDKEMQEAQKPENAYELFQTKVESASTMGNMSDVPNALLDRMWAKLDPKGAPNKDVKKDTIHYFKQERAKQIGTKRGALDYRKPRFW